MDFKVKTCLQIFFFSCTFVIKNKQIQAIYDGDSKTRHPYEKSYKSVTKQNGKYDKSFKERKQVRLLLQ